MFKKLLTYLQYLLPQQLLSRLMGWLAENRSTWFKNYMIRRFIKKYQVDLSEAMIEDPTAYPNFNTFFIRQLKPEVRKIAQDKQVIVSPVDGTVAQIGVIQQNQLLQAKGFYFNLDTLLGNDTEMAKLFADGNYATLYLAPHNYHRVHMPLAGKLLKTIYIPGRLFSVNLTTSEIIPQLYSRNERLISFFQTDIGPMAVILVGAMIVGHIQPIWTRDCIRSPHMQIEEHKDGITLAKGDELGHFKLGSTVILLFPRHAIEWSAQIQSNSTIQYGQVLGSLLR